jgi:sterol desaturase/sphingolipid hydroxylase (fatty acid hydroxylase superfamily)
MTYWAQLQPLLVSLLWTAGILLVFGAYIRVIEVRAPIDAKIPFKLLAADWMHAGMSIGLPTLFVPITAACAAGIVSAAGGGLITLRTDGPWYFVSLIAVVLVNDLSQYWCHRMQHAVPVLWEMHSFHHSAEAVTFITGARHHWIEKVISAALLPIVPIVFKVPPSLSMISVIIFFLPDTCSHSNVRLELGRAVTWINNPQWHRIHHSSLPEHHDKNFAALLPLWDILFGTAWIPKPGEYPPTGLDPQEKIGFIEGLVWPFHKYLRRLRVNASGGRTGAPEPT